MLAETTPHPSRATRDPPSPLAGEGARRADEGFSPHPRYPRQPLIRLARRAIHLLPQGEKAIRCRAAASTFGAWRDDCGDHLLPLREKVPEGRMRGWLHILDVRENPSSVSRDARSTFSRKGRR